MDLLDLLNWVSDWKAILAIGLVCAGAYGGWVLGDHLDSIWGTSYMGTIMALLGGLIGVTLSYFMLRSDFNRRDSDEL
jgi:hypothetical protein